MNIRKFGIVAAILGSFFMPMGAIAQNPIEQELIQAHNKYRQELGLSPLTWNYSLQGSAQAWANNLANRGTNNLEHSQPGENLWMGTTKSYSPTQMVDRWGAEKRYFVPGLFPQVSSTGNWKDVGHYTQMVWRNTTDVGCAIASNGAWDFLVCHYYPYGNVITQPVY
jgi:hypothetical protein